MDALILSMNNSLSPLPHMAILLFKTIAWPKILLMTNRNLAAFKLPGRLGSHTEYTVNIVFFISSDFISQVWLFFNHKINSTFKSN